MVDRSRASINFSKDIFFPILKIGAFGFGGPIAIIALLEKEFVDTQKRISAARFQELYALIKLFPGPVAFQIILALVKEFTGSKSKATTAGIAFLAPSFVMIMGIAFFVIGQLSNATFQIALNGIQIGAIALMAHSVLRLSSGIDRTFLSRFQVFSAGIATYFFPKAEPIIIILYGLTALRSSSPKEFASLLMLFWVCFRSSLLVFGTGIAIVPLLELEFVTLNHWMTTPEFLTALSIGQITPGPVLITSTFLGYQVRGVAGAITTTFGTFLPGVLLSLWVLPLVQQWMNTEKRGERFGKAAFLAVVGGLFASILRFTLNSLHDLPSVILFSVVLAGTLLLKRIPWVLWIIFAGLIHSFT